MSGRPWKMGEADEIRAMARAGLIVAEVEGACGRTRDAIDKKFRDLGWQPLHQHVAQRRNTDPMPGASVDDLDYDDDDTGAGCTQVDTTPPVAADRSHVDREPEPEPRSHKPSSTLKKWLVWSDAHIPFEDPRAFALVLQVARDIRPHGQAIIGDFADFLSVSSHPKTPQQMRWQFKDEVDAVNKRLDELDALGCEERVYFCGNHETRGQRTAAKHAVGLFDSLDPKHLFRLDDRGWKYHAYQQHAAIGKCQLVHDVGHSGKNAANQNGAAFEASTVQGHTHHASVTYFGNVFGERHVSATIGWLGSREAADYMAPIKITRNWQHAFAMLYIEPETQNTHVAVIPIIDYRCVVDGKLYVA